MCVYQGEIGLVYIKICTY